MTINKELNGNALTIAVEGRLDTMTAPELEAELNQSMNSAETLTLDFSKLDYISSAGLRVLLVAKKFLTDENSVRIVNANPLIMEVFKVTGMNEVFTFE